MSKDRSYRDKFVWGHVRQWHEIGEFDIAEYEGRVLHEVRFHPYVSGKDTSNAYFSLDEALIGVIAHKYDGINTQADRLICQMLRMPSAFDKG